MVNLPTITGYELKEFIGSGGSGRVYRAELSGQGRECAVKVFEGERVNRQYLSFCLGKLFSQPANERIIGLVGGDLNGVPYYFSTAYEPRSLAAEAGRYSGDSAWAILRQIAEGGAFLHRQGLVHCNLTSDNVRLSGGDGEAEVKLTDFGMGMIGGVKQPKLGVRAYYLSPEQLRSPDQITGGEGERWDVYSFGVVAFHLLTGKFPRGEKTIMEYLTLAEGATQAGAIPQPADFAALIEAEPELGWPDASESGVEAKRREVIMRCLALSPTERFGDLRDVVEAFEAIDRSEIQASLERQVKAAGEGAKRGGGVAKVVAVLLFLLAVAACGGAGFVWTKWQEAMVVTEKVRSESERELVARDLSMEELAKEAEAAVNASREAIAAQAASREAADRFFEQLISRVPETQRDRVALDTSLAEAERYFTAFLKENSGATGMILERVRAEHNLARIFLIQGRIDEGVAELWSVAGHLAVWLDHEAAHPNRAEVLERLATVKVETARLQLERGDGAGALAAVKDLDRRFVPLLDAGSASDLMRRKLGEGRFYKAKALEWEGKVSEAAGAFGECVVVLGEFASRQELYPDVAAMVSEATSEQGRLLRQNGDLKGGVEQQVEAVEGLLVLTGAYPDSAAYQFLQAKSYAELGMGVAEMGNASDASRAHTESIKILAELVKDYPEAAEYRRGLARGYGEVASIVRDAGDKEKAMEYQRGSVAFLKDLVEKQPESVGYAIDYSREQGRFAEMLSDQGQRTEAMEVLDEALGRIEPYAEVASLNDPEVRALRLTLAKLYGALGHALEEGEKKDDAISHFAKAVEYWKGLADGGRGSESVKEGLAWSQQRLKRLRP
ncbi:MAG: protein kinase [Verrucomicrobiales bacterium]|nr:protein kinase [Verrucomicrobiales bacterium]